MGGKIAVGKSGGVNVGVEDMGALETLYDGIGADAAVWAGDVCWLAGVGAYAAGGGVILRGGGSFLLTGIFD